MLQLHIVKRAFLLLIVVFFNISHISFSEFGHHSHDQFYGGIETKKIHHSNEHSEYYMNKTQKAVIKKSIFAIKKTDFSNNVILSINNNFRAIGKCILTYTYIPIKNYSFLVGMIKITS